MSMQKLLIIIMSYSAIAVTFYSIRSETPQQCTETAPYTLPQLQDNIEQYTKMQNNTARKGACSPKLIRNAIEETLYYIVSNTTKPIGAFCRTIKHVVTDPKLDVLKGEDSLKAILYGICKWENPPKDIATRLSQFTPAQWNVINAARDLDWNNRSCAELANPATTKTVTAGYNPWSDSNKRFKKLAAATCNRAWKTNNQNSAHKRLIGG